MPKIVIPLTLIALLTSACGEKLEPSLVDTSDAGEVTFTEDIQPIGLARCSKCHDFYGTYEKARECGQKCNDKIQRGAMPPEGQLPEEERILFQAWIEQGLPE